MPLPLNLCDDHHPAIAFLGDCPFCAIAKYVEDEALNITNEEGDMTDLVVMDGLPPGVARNALRHDLEQALKESYAAPR